MRPINQNLRNKHIGRYLVDLQRDFIERSLQPINDGGNGVTPYHIAVIARIDLAGTSVSELIRTSGASKQAVSNTLKYLKGQGLVRLDSDPSDKRSRVVRFTAKGERLVALGLEGVETVEALYQKKLGRNKFKQLKNLLAELHDKVRGDGAPGR